MSKKCVTYSLPRQLSGEETTERRKADPNMPYGMWIVTDRMGTAFLGETSVEAMTMAEQYHRSKK